MFTGALVPSGTPNDIVTALHAETVKFLAQPEVKQQLGKLGFEAGGNTPAEFAARIRQEIAAWAKMIEAAKIPKQ